MSKFYDLIAADYDQLINDDVENKVFPYSGYKDIQYLITNEILLNKHLNKAKILDLGIGTGSLYDTLQPELYTLTGIDDSKKMLEIAKLRLPDAKLIEQDLLKGIPDSVKKEKFDYIILSYFVHQFDINYLIDLINQLANNLAPFGKIYIGDIMFIDQLKAKSFSEKNPSFDNYPYYYHNYQDIIKKVDDSFALSYMEINEYSGILIIEKYYESSLHFEESLIKYKTNTAKWKSSQSQKKESKR